MRILLAGPCGVGKTAAAALITSRSPGVVHLDFDRLRVLPDGMTLAPGCLLSGLDLEICLSHHLAAARGGFVLDVGGDTVFRRDADNDQRLQQVLAFKSAHDLSVVVLVASESIVRSRFLECKGRKSSEFDQPWRDWREFGEPFWRRCADRIVDTGATNLADVEEQDAFISAVGAVGAEGGRA